MRTLAIGYVAIGLAVGVGPAAFAQEPRLAGPGNSAGAGPTRVSVAVPIGKVSARPGPIDGEPIYVRRTKAREGMTIVEVSTTPFMPVLASNQPRPAVQRPDQPASW